MASLEDHNESTTKSLRARCRNCRESMAKHAQFKKCLFMETNFDPVWQYWSSGREEWIDVTAR
jgi:hypothetical protein